MPHSPVPPTPALPEAIAQCLRGQISPQITLCRLLLGGADAAAIAALVQSARTPTPEWHALDALQAGRAAQLDSLAAEIRRTASDHTALGGIADIAAFFDRAAAHSPEAAVALYSLGDTELLQAATDEIVAWLREGHLLQPSDDVLDFGCGIGRIAAAVAPHCRGVLGLDVSPGMVAQARARHPALRFEVTAGADIPPGPFGLVLVVDSMPYVMQTGLGDRVVDGVAAALRPGGALVILNLSYGRSPAEDLDQAARWAARHGWQLHHGHPFRLWDAAAFTFRAG